MKMSIGMDFGTSNCEIAKFEYGPPQIVLGPVPSVVGVRSDGSVAYGQEAKDNFDEDRDVRSIKRLLGTEAEVRLGCRRMSVPELAATLMARLKEGAEEKLGQRITDLVITVPSNSKGPQRLATKQCAAALGMKCLTLINEPTAAAIAYGIRSADEQWVLVYDFGGGTFDCTLLRVFSGLFEEVSSKGISRLGGDDFDYELGKQIAAQVERQRGIDLLSDPVTKAKLRGLCEKAKIQLDREASVSIAGDNFLLDSRFFDPRAPHVIFNDVTQERLVALTQGLIHQTREPVEQVLRDANLKKHNIDHVLLVGGQTKMPAVRDFVANLLDRAPHRMGEIDPMTCVAEGAAIVAGIINQAPGTEEYGYVLTLEHSLCVSTLDPARRQKELTPLLSRRSKVPAERTDSFYPIVDYTPSVTVQVYEGDHWDDPGESSNVLLGEFEFAIDPPRPSQEAEFKITYHYEEDGILDVTVEDVATEHRVEATFQNGQMRAPDPGRLRRTVDELLGPTCLTDDPQAGEQRETAPTTRAATAVCNPEADHALAQAQKVLTAMPEDDRKSMESAMRALRDSLEHGEPVRTNRAVEALQDIITTWSYLLD